MHMTLDAKLRWLNQIKFFLSIVTIAVDISITAIVVRDWGRVANICVVIVVGHRSGNMRGNISGNMRGGCMGRSYMREIRLVCMSWSFFNVQSNDTACGKIVLGVVMVQMMAFMDLIQWKGPAHDRFWTSEVLKKVVLTIRVGVCRSGEIGNLSSKRVLAWNFVTVRVESC